MKKDENIRSSFFETSDLPLSTTLVALGFAPHHLDVSNPQRAIFFFTTSDSLQVVVANFWVGNVVVEPKLFWNTQRDLKSRIRNEAEVQKYD